VHKEYISIYKCRERMQHLKDWTYKLLPTQGAPVGTKEKGRKG
jgi:hypothetical protein